MPTTKAAKTKLVKDFKTVVNDAEILIKASADDLSDQAKEARDRLLDSLEHAKQTCSEMEDRFTETAQKAAHETDQAIRSHPYQSVGWSFGVGFLVGLLLSRR